MLGRRRHFVERAVDAVTNFELVLEGLEMDVGGLVADGLADDEIDEADDGRLLRHRLDVVVRELALVLVKIAGADFLQELVEASFVLAKMLANLDVDFIRIRENESNAAPECKREIIDDVRVKRISRE